MNRWGRQLHHYWQRFGTLAYRYKGRTGCARYDTQMLLGSHAVAGHGIPLEVVAVGKAKGWLAGWQAGRQAVGVEMPCG